MSEPILVQIIGAPIACVGTVKDSWRDMSHYAAGKLEARFGETVQVKYYDLFDVDCPSIPPGAQLPVILVNGEMLSNGGKISMPLIRQRVETLVGKAL